jgi:hypothetical protein
MDAEATGIVLAVVTAILALWLLAPSRKRWDKAITLYETPTVALPPAAARSKRTRWLLRWTRLSGSSRGHVEGVLVLSAIAVGALVGVAYVLATWSPR